MIGDLELTEQCDFVYEASQESDKDLRNNPYIADQLDRAQLQILQPNRIKQAYSQGQKHSCAEKNVVELLLNSTLLENMRQWTNLVLGAKGKGKPTTKNEFDAYIGLEIALSIVKFPKIRDYGGTAMFKGHRDFIATMSRDRFQAIRGSLAVHNPL